MGKRAHAVTKCPTAVRYASRRGERGGGEGGEVRDGDGLRGASGTPVVAGAAPVGSHLEHSQCQWFCWHS